MLQFSRTFLFYLLDFPILKYFSNTKLKILNFKLILEIYCQYCKYKLVQLYPYILVLPFQFILKEKLWTWDLLKKFLFFIKQSRYIWNMNFFVLVSVYLKKKNHFLFPAFILFTFLGEEGCGLVKQWLTIFNNEADT